MNSSKEFLMERLELLAQSYPTSIIRYYFDTCDNDHFICVQPEETLVHILDNEAISIHKEFRNLYPRESLSFLDINEDLYFDELLFDYAPKPVLDLYNNLFNDELFSKFKSKSAFDLKEIKKAVSVSKAKHINKIVYKSSAVNLVYTKTKAHESYLDNQLEECALAA